MFPYHRVRIAVVGFALLLALGLPVAAVALTVANGLAPPNPENVIDATDLASRLYVENAPCDGALPPCSPANATTVEVVDGADVGPTDVFENSILRITGGYVDRLNLHGSTHLEMTGGQLTTCRSYIGTGCTANFEFNFESAVTAMIRGGRVPTPISVRNESRLQVDGGFVHRISVWEDSSLNFTGGVIGGDRYFSRLATGVHSFGLGAVATISGDAHGSSVLASNGGLVDVSGGILEGHLAALGANSLGRQFGGAIRDGVNAFSNGVVELEGGALGGDLFTTDNGLIRIFGGSLLGERRSVDLMAHSGGLIEVHGGSFAVDGVPASFGSLSAASGILTGRLSMGEPIELEFELGQGIELIAAPPIYSTYNAGVQTLGPGAGTTRADGDSVVRVDGTDVRFLEGRENSAILLTQARVSGSLLAAGASHVDAVDSVVGGRVALLDTAIYAQNGGEIVFHLEAAAGSRADITDATIGGEVVLADDAQASFDRVSLSSDVGRVTGSGRASLEFHDSNARHLILEGQATARATGSSTLRTVTLRHDSSLVVDGATIGRINASGATRIVFLDGETDSIDTFPYGSSVLAHPWVSVLFAGGTIHGGLHAYNRSLIEVTGGTVLGELTASSFSQTIVRGGEVLGAVRARGNASISISGGAIQGPLLAENSSASIQIEGSQFAIGGMPTPDGVLPVLSGRLTGVLADGSAIDVDFEHASRVGAMGTISVPEPAGLQWIGLLCSVIIGVWRNRRAREN